MAIRKPRGAARAHASFKHDPVFYTPFVLHEWPDEKELRREYTRLRDIAAKRLKRMGQDPEARATPEYQYYSKRLPKLRDMVDRIEIERALAAVAFFVRNPEISTVGGIHARLDAERAAFEEMIDDEDVPDIMTIGEWWAYCHSEGLDKIYASDEIVEYYYTVNGEQKKLNQEMFENWMAERLEWKQYADMPPQTGGSSDEFDL